MDRNEEPEEANTKPDPVESVTLPSCTCCDRTASRWADGQTTVVCVETLSRPHYWTFRHQAVALGLRVHDVLGDGNCLFASLADQFDSNFRLHDEYRAQVVAYMRAHRDDFVAFVADRSFDDYVNELGELGIFAGNDAIVAFARLRQCVICIHQLNKPVWVVRMHCTQIMLNRIQIDGRQNIGDNQLPLTELHIKYDRSKRHYCSLRRADNGQRPTLVLRGIDINANEVLRVQQPTPATSVEIGPYTAAAAESIRRQRRLGNEHISHIRRLLIEHHHDKSAVLEILKKCVAKVETISWDVHCICCRLHGSSATEQRTVGSLNRFLAI